MRTCIHGAEREAYSAGMGSAYGRRVNSVSGWGDGTRVLGGTRGTSPEPSSLGATGSHHCYNHIVFTKQMIKHQSSISIICINAKDFFSGNGQPIVLIFFLVS